MSCALPCMLPPVSDPKLLSGEGGALGAKCRYSSMNPWICRLRRTWSGSALRANTGVRWSSAAGVPVRSPTPEPETAERGRSTPGGPEAGVRVPPTPAPAPLRTTCAVPLPFDSAPFEPRPAPLVNPPPEGFRTEGKCVCSASAARSIAPLRM